VLWYSCPLNDSLSGFSSVAYRRARTAWTARMGMLCLVEVRSWFWSQFLDIELQAIINSCAPCQSMQSHFCKEGLVVYIDRKSVLTCDGGSSEERLSPHARAFGFRRTKPFSLPLDIHLVTLLQRDDHLGRELLKRSSSTELFWS
jgi:hypothetical protein